MRNLIHKAAFLFLLPLLFGCEPALGPRPLTISLSSQEFTVMPHKTAYAVGEAVDPARDLEVFSRESDGSWFQLAPEAFRIDPPAFTVEGIQTVIVTKTAEEGRFASYLVQVGKADSFEPLVWAIPFKTAYKAGETVAKSEVAVYIRDTATGGMTRMAEDRFSLAAEGTALPGPLAGSGTVAMIVTVAGYPGNGLPDETARYTVWVDTEPPEVPSELIAVSLRNGYAAGDTFDPVSGLAVYKTYPGSFINRLDYTAAVPGFSLAVNGTALSASGYTFPEAGAYEVTVTDNAGEAAPFTFTYTVTVRSGSVSRITGVIVQTAADRVAKGGTLQCFALVEGANNPEQSVTWSITSSGHAAGTTINADGLLTVAAGEPRPEITIRATSTVNPDIGGTYTVYLITITKVTVNPYRAVTTVTKGGTFDFYAEVFGERFYLETVTWSIDSVGHAEGTSFYPNNSSTPNLIQIAVAMDEPKSEITIRATSTADPSISGTYTVAVSGAATVDHINISTALFGAPNNDTVKAGESREFFANLFGTGNPARDVIWSIDTPGVAAGTAIISDGYASNSSSAGTFFYPIGRLTVAAAETETEITVRATSVIDPSISATRTVTVQPK
ncbi:MAG: hypothetical protein LBG76_05795 [Treponema sp.]|jgi:hypothetical protein|nr:hypothetical protein [Treponema sp.]